jgi:hypothetical protein
MVLVIPDWLFNLRVSLGPMVGIQHVHSLDAFRWAFQHFRLCDASKSRFMEVV